MSSENVNEVLSKNIKELFGKELADNLKQVIIEGLEASEGYEDGVVFANEVRASLQEENIALHNDLTPIKHKQRPHSNL